MFALGLPEWPVLVRVLGTVFALATLLACAWVVGVKPSALSPARVINLGFVRLPAPAFYKLLALAGFLLLPAATAGIANYHTFEGTKEVSGCASCHVMMPMVNDMRDPHSDTLAARHFRNRWIPEQQCYHCHTDYGLNGTLAAKMEGYRHLVRYTTGIYPEPVHVRGVFNNHNCAHCHEGMPKFEAVPSHHTVRQQLQENTVSCLNCHGAAHPTRGQRTPGSADYDRLMAREP